MPCLQESNEIDLGSESKHSTISQENDLQHQLDVQGQKNAVNILKSTPGDCEKIETPKEANDAEDMRGKPLLLSANDKLGTWATLCLTVGTLLTLSAFGVITFLWFDNTNNGLWHKVMAQDWLTRVVTICAEVIKQAVTLQIGVAVAMAAGLFLETHNTVFPHVASFSIMRASASGGTSWILFWRQFISFCSGRSKSATSVTLFGCVLVLLIIFGTTQVISILLIGDTGSGWVNGLPQSVLTTFGFNYNCLSCPTPNYTIITQDIAWDTIATFYPTFAEYSEPPPDPGDSGVQDTGKTLRAFLPFKDAQHRETLNEYIGRTTVIDARVSCQAPSFADEQLVVELGQIRASLEGSVTASVPAPRLGLASYSANFFRTPFSCAVAGSDNTAQWPLSICQLTQETTTIEINQQQFTTSGGLVSEFIPISTWPDLAKIGSPHFSGLAFLVLNVTQGSPGTISVNTTGIRTTASSKRNEWLDLTISSGGAEGVLSASLCYTAFEQADLSVRLSSTLPRTENAPSWDSTTNTYTFGLLRQQFGQTRGLSFAERGILQLENRQSWIAGYGEMATNSTESYLSASINLLSSGLNFLALGQADGGNFTAYICDWGQGDVDERNTRIIPNTMHVWLMQEILQTGGSIAFAIQSILTLLSSITYYQNLGQFDNNGMVQQTFFVQTTIPQSIRGFTIVALALLVHFLLLFLIIFLFLTRTKFTRLGDSWSALAQAANGSAWIDPQRSGFLGEKEVQRHVKEKGVVNAIVGIENIDGHIGIVKKQEWGDESSQPMVNTT